MTHGMSLTASTPSTTSSLKSTPLRSQITGVGRPPRRRPFIATGHFPCSSGGILIHLSMEVGESTMKYLTWRLIEIPLGRRLKNFPTAIPRFSECFKEKTRPLSTRRVNRVLSITSTLLLPAASSRISLIL